MRTLMTIFLAATVAALMLAPAAGAHRGGGGRATTLAVYGDAPYGTTPTDTAQVKATPGFIDSINADPDVGLVLHVGDIHSGKQYCTSDYDQTIFDLWTRFEDPLVYTPGDNEWTDCHKAAEGGGKYNPATGQIDYVRNPDGTLVDYAGGDPVANRALVRSLFFPRPGLTLGARKRPVLSQAFVSDRAHPADRRFVENVLWAQSRTLFVTIDLPGGSNNDTDPWYGAPSQSAAQQREVAERTGADLRWLDLAFRLARLDRGIKAVVIGAQADMWDPEAGAAHQAGYEPFVQSVASNTTRLGKPVLMFNGDSHVYQSGNPLAPGDPNYAIHPGYDVPNFHRVVVHGSTFPLEWLKLKVDPRADNPASDTTFGPFSWQREIQP
jgi:hypothetical protein